MQIFNLNYISIALLILLIGLNSIPEIVSFSNGRFIFNSLYLTFLTATMTNEDWGDCGLSTTCGL